MPTGKHKGQFRETMLSKAKHKIQQPTKGFGYTSRKHSHPVVTKRAADHSWANQFSGVFLCPHIFTDFYGS